MRGRGGTGEILEETWEPGGRQSGAVPESNQWKSRRPRGGVSQGGTCLEFWAVVGMASALRWSTLSGPFQWLATPLPWCALNRFGEGWRGPWYTWKMCLVYSLAGEQAPPA